MDAVQDDVDLDRIALAGRVTVIGAGVIGLTCAVRLAEAGARVDVLARDLPLETTSAVAGGLWLPYRAEPAADVARWAIVAYRRFAALADVPEAGVRMLPGTMLARDGMPEPAWMEPVRDVASIRPERDPVPGRRLGWSLTAPLVRMPVYLPYLAGRLAAAGGTLTRMALSEVPRRGVVLNCTGLSARGLVPDPAVVPVRGQIVHVADPGLQRWWTDEREVDGQSTYVLPHGAYAVLGGTAQEGDWSRTPDEATARAILERAADLVPQLRGARVLGHRVGLRPVRPAVRLEVEPAGPEGQVVHCYGHGGSGVTLAWGCADDVLLAVRDLLAA
jgi:D-amino-acid oxidase